MSITCLFPHAAFGSFKFIICQTNEFEYQLIADDVMFHSEISVKDPQQIIGGGYLTIIKKSITLHGKSDKYGAIIYTDTIKKMLKYAISDYDVIIHEYPVVGEVGE